MKLVGDADHPRLRWHQELFDAHEGYTSIATTLRDVDACIW
jgi:hypothetical protein